MGLEWVAILGVLLVVASVTLAPKVGVAAPLLLVALGFAVALLPMVDRVVIQPEWILGGVLPPLLYSAAVNTPAMDFRRDVRLISAFSVLLVLVSALGIGFIITALVPGLPLGVGIALGAIISPTDAVATSIVRQAGVSPRIVTVLEGESLLNDASALVLLRSAVAAVGVSISWWQVAGDFVWAVLAAVAIGYVVGKLNLLARSRISQVPASVAVSLVVPFLAYLPAEHLGASGLVAAVAAGLVTGHGEPRALGPAARLSEQAVWRTIELLLESAVFLLVGLELPTLVADLTDRGGSLGQAVWLAVIAATAVIALRAGFVAWSVWTLARRSKRTAGMHERLGQLRDHLDDGTLPQAMAAAGRTQAAAAKPRPLAKKRLQLARRRAAEGTVPPEVVEARTRRWEQLVRRRLADLDYLAAEKFGWREGAILVWAGMRGAVTIAAAQSLPANTTSRSLMIVVATLVAVGTLIIQGGTLGYLAERLKLTGRSSDGDPETWTALQIELTEAAVARLEEMPDIPADIADRMRQRVDRLRQSSSEDSDFGPTDAEAAAARAKFREVRLTLIAAQRDKLLAIRDLGSYPSAMLDAALAQLDADQLGMELHRG